MLRLQEVKQLLCLLKYFGTLTAAGIFSGWWLETRPWTCFHTLTGWTGRVGPFSQLLARSAQPAAFWVCPCCEPTCPHPDEDATQTACGVRWRLKSRRNQICVDDLRSASTPDDFMKVNKGLTGHWRLCFLWLGSLCRSTTSWRRCRWSWKKNCRSWRPIHPGNTSTHIPAAAAAWNNTSSP